MGEEMSVLHLPRKSLSWNTPPHVHVDMSQEWVYAHLDKFKLQNPFKKSNTLDRETEEAHLEFPHGLANLEYNSTAVKYGNPGPKRWKVALDSYKHLHPRT